MTDVSEAGSSIKAATAGDVGIDFKAIKQRFIAINAARLQRTREALRPGRQRDFLDLLPLLFHANHPMLPGYVSKETPAGLPGYQPNARALDAAKRLTRSFHYRKQAYRRFPLHAIYFMGSPGTVGYSQDSDFDIWLCHSHELEPAQRTELQQKAREVEKWAATLDLEVHIFLVEPEEFRQGAVSRLSDESSGTAQHNLLLEEFYRTGLCLSGHYPLWWLVPPHREGDYDAYVQELKDKRFLHARDHIDLGGLAHIPAEEFFGAALWQLYKGIDSPYKSVLKLLLMEAYASEYPQMSLLSLRFKQAVYDGEESLDRLDPYLMMLEKVSAYLQAQEEHERLELARRCFYFKTELHLSHDTPEDWQHRLLATQVRSWGWSHADLLLMDSRDTWKVHRVSEERRILFEALSTSYRFLSDFARKYAGLAMISQRDLNILGRKLYAAFERKAGKVDLLNRGITPQLTEPRLSLHEVVPSEQRSVWQLYRGAVNPAQADSLSPIKRARSLVELIAWCYFNSLLDRQTAVGLFPLASALTTNEFNALFERMRQIFPLEILEAGPMEAFAKPARVIRGALFVNVGLNPFASLGPDGDLITSNRSDPLCYSSSGENLVLSIDQVLVTSWQEVLTFRHAGAEGLMKCLCEYLMWQPPGMGERPQPITVYGFSLYRGGSIAQRIGQLFEDVINCFYAEGADPQTRYIVAARQGFFVLYFEGETARYRHLESYPQLLRYLGTPQESFAPVVFDRHALQGQTLPLIYRRNRPGLVQFFYQPQGEEVDVFVLDERGSLFSQRIPFHDAPSLLNQYSRFFEAVLNRINFLMQEGQTLRGAEGVEFNLLGRDGSGALRMEKQSPEFRSATHHYLSLQVMVDVEEGGQTVFTLYCNDREFSTLEYGGKLFDAVVRHVLELRRSGQSYPIYITDISMSRPVLGEEGAGKVQTLHFLTYKQRIENELNITMERLSRE